MQTRAKELGILDITNLSNQQEINEKQIKVFDNILTNIDNNEPLVSKEVEAYIAMGDTYKEIMNMKYFFLLLQKQVHQQQSVYHN